MAPPMPPAAEVTMVSHEKPGLQSAFAAHSSA
jgi:hypothetical protein